MSDQETKPYVYCRPHWKTLPPDQKFIVRTWRGLDLGTRVVPEGAPVPTEEFTRDQLRCLYERLVIEVAPAPPKPELPDLETRSRAELAELCREHGLPNDGSKIQLRDRLAALVA